MILRAFVAAALAAGLLVGHLRDAQVLALFAVAFASDYFDGVIARACHVVEGVAISLTLPVHLADVPTLAHAMRERRQR